MTHEIRGPYHPGTVDWKSSHGTIFLYQANTQNPDNITMSIAALCQATLAPGAGVFCDGERIGTVQSISFESQRKALIAVIRLEVKDTITLPDPGYLLAVPTLDTLGVKCPLCSLTFTLNSSPCACIYRAPVVIVEKIRVVSVLIFDIRHHDTKQLDGRPGLLRQHFSGAVGSLLLIEPL